MVRFLDFLEIKHSHARGLLRMYFLPYGLPSYNSVNVATCKIVK